ncbi:MAG: hypothetical protein KJ077_10720 [Anaerolineae bacterium]|nr:hypothetical protein [Anaerolineae bacterium]
MQVNPANPPVVLEFNGVTVYRCLNGDSLSGVWFTVSPVHFQILNLSEANDHFMFDITDLPLPPGVGGLYLPLAEGERYPQFNPDAVEATLRFAIEQGFLTAEKVDFKAMMEVA